MPQKTPKFTGAYELVVIAKPDAGLRARRGADGGIASVAGASVASLAKILKGASISPLFQQSEERLTTAAAAHAAATGVQLPDLSVFYKVEADPEKMEEMAEKLRGHEAIAAAYVKPPAEPAVVHETINAMTASEEDAPPATPDFEPRQTYLGAAPTGVEALWAHGRPGGRGNGVRVIDIEGAWRFSHEDLVVNQGGVIGGVQINNLSWRNHGTAVIGVFGGDVNAFGVKGIAPSANTRARSIFLNASGSSASSSTAIHAAADALSPGDIILIELHRPGPDASGSGQDGYIAIEWWEDDFQAIKYATSKGVLVVEAAGNGSRDLDAAIFSVKPVGFPAGWTNPFNRSNRDSGAIVVGAGAPPPGTHGHDHGPDRSRLGFSNWGALVDAQGWGREVTTTGYGDLQGGANEDLWYTDQFSGTSSASPIVVGAVACVQGIRKAAGQAVLTPAQMRAKLRSTGSPQTDAPGRPKTQRIGNRPNIKQMVAVKQLKIEKPEKFEKVEKLEKNEIKEIKEGKSEFEKQFDLIEHTGGQQSLEERVSALESALGLPAAAAPAAAPLICTALAGMPLGPKPNPLIGTQAQFLVRGAGGVPLPSTSIIQPTPALRGLNCGFRTDIALAANASRVVLALGHLSGAGAIRALNPAGAVIAGVAFNPALNVLQTYTLNAPFGQVIRRVVITAPNDRTILARFCFQKAGLFPGASAEGEAAFDPFAGAEAHFIDESLRPDLSGGALTGEEDFQGFGSGDKDLADVP